MQEFKVEGADLIAKARTEGLGERFLGGEALRIKKSGI